MIFKKKIITFSFLIPCPTSLLEFFLHFFLTHSPIPPSTAHSCFTSFSTHPPWVFQCTPSVGLSLIRLNPVPPISPFHPRSASSKTTTVNQETQFRRSHPFIPDPPLQSPPPSNFLYLGLNPRPPP